MELYKIGKIMGVGSTYIILESNLEGKVLYVPKPNEFTKGTIIKVFVYIYKTEFTRAMYGFKTFDERQLFANLISVNGIGPKTAILLLKDGVEKITNAIGSGDLDILTSYPTLGPKTANQLVFELRDKYVGSKAPTTKKLNDALKSLGFTKKQITYALKNIKISSSIEKDVEKAIKIISNVQHITA